MSPSPDKLERTLGLADLRQANRVAEARIIKRLNFLAPSYQKYTLKGFVFDRDGKELYIHPLYQGEDQRFRVLGGARFDKEFEVFPTKVTDTNVAWGSGLQKAYPWSDTMFRLFLDENGRLGLESPNNPPQIEAVVLMRGYNGVNLIDQLTTDEADRSTLVSELDRQSLISQLEQGLERTSGCSIDEI